MAWKAESPGARLDFPFFEQLKIASWLFRLGKGTAPRACRGTPNEVGNRDASAAILLSIYGFRRIAHDRGYQALLRKLNLPNDAG